MAVETHPELDIERQVQYRRLADNPGEASETVTIDVSEVESIADPYLRYALQRKANENPDGKWSMGIVAKHDETLDVIYFPKNENYDPSRLSSARKEFSWHSVWHGLKRAVLPR